LGQNRVAYRKSASYLVWKCLKSLSVGWGGVVGGGPTDYFVTLNLT
jgi:hypothetical protein